MKYHDYYATLGASKDASQEEIKKQYRRLARKYHPDVSKEKGAEEKFKEMKEAYEVLKDPEKRKAYDQMGQGFNQGESFTPPPGWNYQQTSAHDEAPHYSGADFSDFFESLFGQHGRGARQRPFEQTGQDQHSKLDISLEEAFHGGSQQIVLTQPVLDPQTGHVKNTERHLNVKIPAGVTQGQQIRLTGQGAAGLHGGKSGDLYLEINIKPHALYKLDKKDIYLNLPVTPWEAALGEKIHVPTLGGTIAFTLPKNSQTGQKIRLKGRGLPGKMPGDQYIILSIQIPEPTTSAQEALYKKMQAEMPFNPRQHLFTDTAK